MNKRWIAVLSLAALLVAGALAGSALAQTGSSGDSDGGAASEERGHDSDGDGASEERGHDSDDDGASDSDGGVTKIGGDRFVELLAENLGISEDETRTALETTYEQLEAERRAAWEQAVRDALAKAVEAGKITQEEADEKLAAFLDRDSDDSDSRWTRGFGKRGHHGFRGGHGRIGGWFGWSWGADKDSADSDEGDDDGESAAA